MKKILIIGAGMLQTYVIKKSKELGYFTIAVDGNPDAEGFKYCDAYKCINITDENACLSYALEMKIDGVLTAATDYGVLTASYISEKMGLVGIPTKVARIIKNKYSVRKVLNEKNVRSIPQCFEVSTEAQALEISDKINYPVIVKPCDASGSRAVNKAKSTNELIAACKEAISQSLTKKACIESFIEGCEYGVESFVVRGKVNVLGVMKKTMTSPPYYAELGHSLPSGLDTETENKFIKAATDIITALGITAGSVNMDFILGPGNTPYMVDIGARMGGNLIGSHIIPLGSGYPYIENMLRAAAGDELCSDILPKKQISTKILNLRPGTVAKSIGKQELYDKFPFLEYVKLNFDIGKNINEYKTNLDGCGYVVCTGENLHIAEENSSVVRDYIDNNIVRK